MAPSLLEMTYLLTWVRSARYVGALQAIDDVPSVENPWNPTENREADVDPEI